MGMLRRRSTYKNASEWPAWTDEVRFGLGPSPEEEAWAAAHLNEDFHTTDETPDEILDRQAEEALALDRHERGLNPF